jgi:CubicO group peptidase (beta-lactamase class C family)
LESATLYLCFGDQPFADVFGKARRPNALFLLGSITKTMTATGVMLLADRGELKISDPVMKFIPEFSEGARKEITIEHLLTHTSGLPDQLENNADLRARHAPLAEFVQGAILAPLLFTPGTRYHYQSMGILLAAEVAERITKKRFPDFLDEKHGLGDGRIPDGRCGARPNRTCCAGVRRRRRERQGLGLEQPILA